jgi:hypothetical protein
MSFGRQIMVKYLQAQTPVLKQPMALTVASNTKFVQVHNYTQNRNELIEIVKSICPSIHGVQWVARAVGLWRLSEWRRRWLRCSSLLRHRAAHAARRM